MIGIGEVFYSGWKHFPIAFENRLQVQSFPRTTTLCRFLMIWPLIYLHQTWEI